MTVSNLSVVIPTRNSERFLPELLDSLAASTSTPREYIFVDGESSDGTIGLLKRFAALAPIRIISSPPRGIYDAWNRGCALANGDWIWIVCSDDLTLPDGIGVFGKQIGACPSSAGFVLGNINVVDGASRTIDALTHFSPLHYLSSDLTRLSNSRSAQFEAVSVYLFRSYFLSFMAHSFRKAVWAEYPFRTDIGSSADIEWTLKAHLRGWGRQYFPATVGAWRIHSGAATSSFRPLDRVAAHRRLMSETIHDLKDLIGCQSLGKLDVLPGHDIYDYVSGLTDSTQSLAGRLEILTKMVPKCAGFRGMLELIAQKIGYGRARYLRPRRQFESILPKWREHISFL